MWTATKNTKCCATCVYWQGIRKEIFGNAYETPSPSERGRCGAGVPADATPGPVACGGRNCNKYIKL